ncbi:hypothetical protein GTS_40420 [Gandjariella thermophila]|uniref:Uncharacterized protein n=1 Tax=Gandjariella thermophila TaxID=1931992 RepID=A0A4D4JDG8_9PSEU|nr:hypothetical protein GTS_40420 [Gandjariella thermophila]
MSYAPIPGSGSDGNKGPPTARPLCPNVAEATSRRSAGRPAPITDGDRFAEWPVARTAPTGAAAEAVPRHTRRPAATNARCYRGASEPGSRRHRLPPFGGVRIGANGR